MVCLSSRSSDTSQRSQILNVEIDNLSNLELLYELKSGFLVTPNVDHLIQLQHNRSLFQAYKSANYKVCDSSVLLKTAEFLGYPLKEKIAGSDFFSLFCKFHRNSDRVKIFLLGGVDGAAEIARANLNRRLDRDIIIDTYEPPFGFECDEVECELILERIRTSGATVLAVGVGCPKQEIWIAKYRSALPSVQLFMAIGATINFEAGMVRRAPQWMQNISCEWLYRLLSEPRRLWRRYLVEDVRFFWLIAKQFLRLYESPFN